MIDGTPVDAIKRAIIEGVKEGRGERELIGLAFCGSFKRLVTVVLETSGRRRAPGRGVSGPDELARRSRRLR